MILPVIAPLDENGVYVAGFGWLSGRHSQEVAEAIFDNCARRAFTTASSATPTATRTAGAAAPSWSTAWWTNGSSAWASYDKPREELTAAEKARSLRYQIMDRVDQINWYPGFGYDREMDWLRNMHDWMISKKRYWGLALPIWECDECGHFDVIG
jgi:isoleucyl-tRNA synthetase